jgi:hypothetical protein
MQLALAPWRRQPKCSGVSAGTRKCPLLLSVLRAVVGAWRELGLMRHDCLAFMVIGDDGLDHRKAFPGTNTQTEREFS